MISIVFMGSAEFSSVILKELVQTEPFKVVAVFSQPDKPVGRKQELTPPHTAVSAMGLSLPLYQPEKLRDEQSTELIRNFAPDFIVVAAYGQIVPKAILDIAPCINLHTSLLPKFRGAAALQGALLEGSQLCGVTAILMDEKLDTGDILGIIAEETPREARYECYLRRLGFLAANLLKDILLNYQFVAPLKQIEADASNVAKIKKEDGEVNLSDATQLYQKYQAYYPWPGIFLASGLKLKEVELLDASREHKIGEVLEIGADFIVIGCGKGCLKISKLQLPGKNETDGASFARGRRLGVGDTLS